MNIVSQLYPDCKSSEEIRRFILNTIEDRLGLQEDEILFIESTSGNYTSPVKRKQTNQARFLNVGGLAGFPFQGVSGLNVTSEAISENGGVLIFYACDVDLGTDHKKKDRDLSLLSDRGSEVNMALMKLINGQILLEHISELDYQMNFIEQLLFREQRKIKTAAFPLVEAAEVVYEAIDRRMQLLFAKTNYTCRYAVLAGAICFQDQSTGELSFALKRMVCLDPSTKNKIDWKRVAQNG